MKDRMIDSPLSIFNKSCSTAILEINRPGMIFNGFGANLGNSDGRADLLSTSGNISQFHL